MTCKKVSPIIRYLVRIWHINQLARTDNRFDGYERKVYNPPFTRLIKSAIHLSGETSVSLV